MSDIKSIKNVNPAWPIKPVQPSRKDRDRERKSDDLPETGEEEDDNRSNFEDTIIDEYV